MANLKQWDQTPGRTEDSERVRVAWDMAATIAQSAIDRLKELNNDVDKARNNNDIKRDPKGQLRKDADVNKRLRQFIAASDPA